MPSYPPRRAVVRALALTAAAAALASGCDDAGPGGSGRSGSPGGPAATPTRDPQVVAAMRAADGRLRQLATRYDAVVRRHPRLATPVAAARRHHAVHLARVRALGGIAATPAPKPTAPAVPATAVPATAAAALDELAATEQRQAIAHATAAPKLSGEPARVLAMLAASQTQLAVALGRTTTTRAR